MKEGRGITQEKESHAVARSYQHVDRLLATLTEYMVKHPSLWTSDLKQEGVITPVGPYYLKPMLFSIMLCEKPTTWAVTLNLLKIEDRMNSSLYLPTHGIIENYINSVRINLMKHHAVKVFEACEYMNTEFSSSYNKKDSETIMSFIDAAHTLSMNNIISFPE